MFLANFDFCQPTTYLAPGMHRGQLVSSVGLSGSANPMGVSAHGRLFGVLMAKLRFSANGKTDPLPNALLRHIAYTAPC